MLTYQPFLDIIFLELFKSVNNFVDTFVDTFRLEGSFGEAFSMAAIKENVGKDGKIKIGRASCRERV